MILSELQAIVLDIKTKTITVEQSSGHLMTFVDRIDTIVNSEYGPTINVDAFVAIQTPLYVALLNDLQNAVNALTGNGLQTPPPPPPPAPNPTPTPWMNKTPIWPPRKS